MESYQQKIDGNKRVIFLSLAIVFLLVDLFFIWQYRSLGMWLETNFGLGLVLIIFGEGIFLLITTLFYYRTVTAAKIATEELELAEIKIEREKARDEALLESIGDGVVATDKDGYIIFINKVAEELLVWHEVLGKKLAEVSLLADEAGKHVSVEKHPLHQCLLTLQRVVTKNFHFILKDNSNLAVYISATPVILKEEIVGAIEVFRDITKEMEIDQAKSEFVSLASHQLRTPLSTISWYTEMLLDGDAGEVNPEQKKYLQEVYESNHRMIDLVNSLLNVSRIELGTFSIKSEPVKLQEIVEEMLEELMPLIKQRQVKIVKKYDKNLHAIQADPNLLGIIFQNLLSNAVKYTSTAGFVEVEIFERDKDIFIKVADNGCGIPKEQQGNIFTKLFRADNVRERVADGNGLGLYIIKSIVEQSGGKIWFESEENKGTSFYITLPLIGKSKEGRTKILAKSSKKNN